MIRFIINVVLFLIVGAGFFVLNLQFDYEWLAKSYQTSFTLGVLYLIFRVVLTELATRRISTAKTRYAMRKALLFLFYGSAVVGIITIWTVDIRTLSVAYGLLAAGLAVAFQDVFKSFMGGFIIFLNGTYTVGDRIEADGVYGDVMDIGLLYTSLLEIQDWVGADQPTGRIISLPNSVVLAKAIKNYTKDHSFIWDAMVVPISYRSNTKKAMELALKVLEEQTGQTSDTATRQIRKLRQRYFFKKLDVEPNVFMRLTDNWVEMHLRYTVDVRDRRAVQHAIYEALLAKIKRSRSVELATSSTIVYNADYPKM